MPPTMDMGAPGWCMLLSTGPGIGLYEAYETMDGTPWVRAAPGYCSGGAMAGIEVLPRGMAPEEVIVEAVVGDGCVTGEVYEG